jgi:predicted CoA-substrate-specific enzyme activase
MITAGVDCGAKTIKVVVMKDGKIIGKSLVPAGFDTKPAANQAFDEAVKAAGIEKGEIQKIFTTGSGKKETDFAKDEITEVNADAIGINFLMPSIRTVIDVGAEEGRAVRLDGTGKVIDFAINQKCAAGAGTFVEAMARALETTVDKMADLYNQSTKEIPMNARCVVFAESELVTLIHSQTWKPDIARAVLVAIADRVASMLRRVGIEYDIAAIGGVALNGGFIVAVEREMNIKLIVPEEPQFVGAIGAALAASE